MGLNPMEVLFLFEARIHLTTQNRGASKGFAKRQRKSGIGVAQDHVSV
jgi:hypothetical protein